MKRSGVTAAAGIATAGGILALWEVADGTGLIALDVTASPSEIAAAWWTLTQDGELGVVTLHTLRVFLISWVLAVMLGAIVGLAIGSSRRASEFVGPTVTFLRFVPPPALVPVVLILWGFSMRSEITIAIYAGMWPVAINVAAGASTVDSTLLEMGRTLRMNTLERLRKLALPATLPMLATGSRIAASICLIVVVTAEMLGVPRGIGYQIVRASQALRPAEAFAYVLWIGVIGVAVNMGVTRSQRALLPWDVSSQSQ